MPPMFGAPDYNYYDAWLDRLVANATPEPKPEPLPLWLPEIEEARKSGRILDPYDEAIKMARGE